MDDHRDYRLVDIPGYVAWSRKRIEQGDAALIAHLDATCIWLRPSELGEISEDVFDDLLDDLRSSLGSAGLGRENS